MCRIMREFDFINWIRSQNQGQGEAVVVGPGDDCAVLQVDGARLLVTTDAVLDGVHFKLNEHGPEAAGRKALARNLSDIAAMAGEPIAAVAAVALPKRLSDTCCRDIYRGLERLGREFSCPIVGGDISRWNRPLTITVTVIGKPIKGVDPVLRSTAQVGDAIVVTGPLGRAWRGDKHLQFVPRIKEAARIARFQPSAMIDISDGLAADLGHICRESGVGAEIRSKDIPLNPDATIAEALGDGEDYELLFTINPTRFNDLAKEDQDLWLKRIGTVVEGCGMKILDPAGHVRELQPRGWEHLGASKSSTLDVPCTITTRSLRGTTNLGRKIGALLELGDTVSLIGDLGAGKTSLVRGIAEGMGLQEKSVVSSPTFVLVQEYSARLPIYHLDLYRMSEPDHELEDLGIDEMLTSGVVLIEWADRAPGSIPHRGYEVRIDHVDQRGRRFHIRRLG